MVINDLSVVVVMGGTSTEREVSLRSGQAIFSALSEKGYNVRSFVLNKDNARDLLDMSPDVVFIALHGKGGEDGSIQGMLELAGIPYTGAGVAGSAVCMNKVITKELIRTAGIRTADYIPILPLDVPDKQALADRSERQLGYPVVVKAACQGSSVGVQIANDREQLLVAMDSVYRYDNEMLLESFLPGKELTVPLTWTPDGFRIFPIIEIVPQNEFYDYDAKYTVGKSRHIVPAPIPEAVKQEIEDMAVRAYRVLHCAGLVRVDLMTDAKGLPYFMEINTIPGMTETSLVPDAARAAGMSFPDLVDCMLKTAIEGRRHA